MKQKLLALLLVLSLILCLAACGGSTPAPEQDASPAASAGETAPESAAEAEAPAPADIQADQSDIEEAETQETAESQDAQETSEEMPAEAEDPMAKYITPDNIEDLIAGRPAVSLPVSEDGTTFTFWTGSPAMDATISGWNDSTAAQEMEKRTGVHIDYIEVAPPVQSESLNLMFASGDFPNILNYAITGLYSVPYLIENDIVVDLQDMMAENAPSYSALMEADPALYLATVDDEGQIGGLAGYQYNSFTVSGTIVRSDWVEKVGMTVEGLQTIDDYYDYLTAIKSQGLCEYPMPLRYDASISGSPFLAAMGARAGAAGESSANSFIYDENDNLTYTYITDTYRDYITMMAKWYDEGLITRDLLSWDMLDSSAIAGGSYGVFWQDCQFMDYWISAGQVNDPDYMLAGASEPKLDPEQTVGFSDITMLTINLAICTSCQDPETALRWLDYHFSEEGSLLSQYGLEGEGLAFDENGNPCYSELISNNPDGLSTDNALNQYAININMYAKNCETLKAAYSDIQRDALEKWTGVREVNKSSFTSLFTLNTEETETVQRHYADISTYVAEQIGKMLVGELAVDNVWDDFVSTVESMGIAEVAAAYQSAGNRYFGRIS